MRGIAMLFVLAGMGCGFYFVMAKPVLPAPVAPVPTTVITPNQPTVAVLPLTIILECESPTTLEDKSADGSVVYFKVGQYSEGKVVKYLESPEGWIKNCSLEEKQGKPEMLPGRASWEFEAGRDDTFYLNLRAKWYDTCGNSVYLKIDESNWFKLEDQNGEIDKKNYKWAWHPLFVGGRPKGFELKAGKHTLYICTAEDGPLFDQWVLSTDAQPPVGDEALKK